MQQSGDMLPILVGVVGKRQFDPDPELNTRLRAVFADRFSAMVAALDATLPDTPKVLVCGGAAGTDLIALRAILAADGDGRVRHPAWSAVIMLPFDAAIFGADFADPAFAADLPLFQDIVAGRLKRVILKQLRGLHVAPFDDRKLEPPQPVRVDPQTLLAGSPVFDAGERKAHFEQLALWLARYATILVAASPSETANLAAGARMGGTARAVAFRRAGWHDADAGAVIARSSELLTDSPLEEPSAGHVLWIDPAEDCSRRHGHWAMLRVLRPLKLTGSAIPGSPELSHHDIYHAPFADPLPQEPFGGRQNDRRCQGALALPLAFQSFHRRRIQANPGRDTAKAAPFGPDHPAAFLEDVRNGHLGTQQLQAAERTRTALRWSAFLFFLAITSYEAYTELIEESLAPLVIYLVLLMTIWGIALVLDHSSIQLRAEDYRGVREMLRVQIAWWSSGVDRMVDRVHLRRVDSDLRLVREAAATIAAWAMLRCSLAPHCDFRVLRRTGRPSADAAGPASGMAFAQDWIDGQAKYFVSGAAAQSQCKILADDSFRVVLATALVGLLGLTGFLFLSEHTSMAEVIAAGREAHAAMILALFPLTSSLVAINVLWVVTSRPRGSPDRAGRRAKRRAGRRAAAPKTPGLWDCLRPWPLPVAFAVSILLIAIQVGCLSSAGFAKTMGWAGLVLPWLGPASFLMLLLFGTFNRIPGRAEALMAVRLTKVQTGLAVLLLSCTLFVTAATFAPTAAQWRRPACTETQSCLVRPMEPAAFRALVLAQTVLLLGGAGMVRWYTERRNHQAQAVHYADMARTFRRAGVWLRSLPVPPDAAASAPQQEETLALLVELGELALDEGEAWLKAHRNRPPEAIAG